MTQVLVVDDEAPMRAALEANFRRAGWGVTTAIHGEDAISKFRSAPCPLVVTDMRMANGDGLSVLHEIRRLAPDAGVIFLTAYANIPEAVQAMRDGACDYLVKPVAFEQLKESAERVLGRSSATKSAKENEALIGGSPALRRLVERARQVARSEMDVLVEAESGTGKELLARLIHQSSDRRNRPFVAINCAAFPETLLESELFGHARGAFTGATTAKPGKFELAHTGTLLLDEIGELPLSLQPKLLRVLQEREVDRLGDTRPLQIDVRVIATTNRSLLQLVEEGKFRADLYYRLNVVPLTIPPLRERREDIAALAEYFLRKHSRRSAGGLLTMSAELTEMLSMHHWPGNVRELENFIRRAVALASGPVIGIESMEEMGPFMLQPAEPERAMRPAESGVTLREMEKQLLESTLTATGGNRTHAAKVLGICPRTMRNKIREYGLPPRRYA